MYLSAHLCFTGVLISRYTVNYKLDSVSVLRHVMLKTYCENEYQYRLLICVSFIRFTIVLQTTNGVNKESTEDDLHYFVCVYICVCFRPCIYLRKIFSKRSWCTVTLKCLVVYSFISIHKLQNDITE